MEDNKNSVFPELCRDMELLDKMYKRTREACKGTKYRNYHGYDKFNQKWDKKRKRQHLECTVVAIVIFLYTANNNNGCVVAMMTILLLVNGG